MEQDEIVRRNTAIATYMGFRDPKSPSKGYSLIPPNKHETYRLRVYTLKGLKFHSDWSWLMPVVERIMDAGSGPVTLWRLPNNWVVQVDGDTPDTFGATMKEAVWISVSDYCISLQNEGK